MVRQLKENLKESREWLEEKNIRAVYKSEEKFTFIQKENIFSNAKLKQIKKITNVFSFQNNEVNHCILKYRELYGATELMEVENKKYRCNSEEDFMKLMKTLLVVNAI